MKNKKWFLLLSAFFLVGCQSLANNKQEVEEESVEVANIEESSIEEEVKEEVTAVGRTEGVPLAWTNYSTYAVPNEAGFAYVMHDDPDVSSEIYPINDDSYGDVLLFTFDDAPYENASFSSVALDMAKLMKEKDVNAIFLVNGMYLDSEHGQEIIRQVHDLGFEIGNHTEYHLDLRTLSYDEQYEEILTTNEKIEAITHEPVRWFRPPFGSYNMDTILICNDLGLQLMGWTFGYDWMEEYQDGFELADISLTTDHLHGGANILMHDREWTLEALDALIDGYREMGYEIVDPYLIEHQVNSTEPL